MTTPAAASSATAMPMATFTPAAFMTSAATAALPASRMYLGGNDVFVILELGTIDCSVVIGIETFENRMKSAMNSADESFPS